MRYVLRLLVIAVALAVLVVNPVVKATASGNELLALGVFIDVAAIAAAGAAVTTWRRRAAA